MPNVFRNIPSVNELLDSPPLRRVIGRVNRNTVVSRVRDFLDNLRDDLQSAASDIKVPTANELAERIADWISREEQPHLRPVINATGKMLHAGLGRAPLAAEALQAIHDVGIGYASVEVDLESGARSERIAAVERRLRRLTGAEAAFVVNNKAAATLLTLAAIASGREVMVSHGDLFDDGDGYRLPEMVKASGTRLREVGSTNVTRAGDYQSAIGPDTAALLRFHPAGFAIIGFTESPPLSDLAALARKHEVPLIHDIDSGALIDFGKYGVAGEPVVADCIRAGADLVLFNGDKLLGGPQCGVIVGRRSLIQRIGNHPLARAMSVGKVTLAALEATLALYDDLDQLEQRLPFFSLLSTPIENLKLRADRLAPQLAATEAIAEAEVVQDSASVGGESLPSLQIPTWCIAVTPSRGSVGSLHARFRLATPAVVGRVKEDRLLFDLRTVFPREDLQLIAVAEQLGHVAGEPEDASRTDVEDQGTAREIPASSILDDAEGAE